MTQFKVFCKDCDYSSFNGHFNPRDKCRHPKAYDSRSILQDVKHPIYELCRNRNKDYNCPDFKEKANDPV